MITDGRLPKPVKLTNGSVLFPLEDLTAWAIKKGSPALAAEFKRLAFARQLT
jgi:predicted DNA-binding transcriptional regulator AlpA